MKRSEGPSRGGEVLVKEASLTHKIITFVYLILGRIVGLPKCFSVGLS